MTNSTISESLQERTVVDKSPFFDIQQCWSNLHVTRCCRTSRYRTVTAHAYN